MCLNFTPTFSQQPAQEDAWRWGYSYISQGEHEYEYIHPNPLLWFNSIGKTILAKLSCNPSRHWTPLEKFLLPGETKQLNTLPEWDGKHKVKGTWTVHHSHILSFCLLVLCVLGMNMWPHWQRKGYRVKTWEQWNTAALQRKWQFPFYWSPLGRQWHTEFIWKTKFWRMLHKDALVKLVWVTTSSLHLLLHSRMQVGNIHSQLSKHINHHTL